MTKIEPPKKVLRPWPPTKQLRDRTVLFQSTEDITNAYDIPILDLKALVKEYGEDIFIEFDQNWTGYDNDSQISYEIYSEEVKDNPDYDKLMEKYQADMKSHDDYLEQLSKYEEKMEELYRQSKLDKEREQYEKLKAKFEGES